MDLRTMRETPPWDWPEDSGKLVFAILTNRLADASDRIIAAELAGDFSLINDKIAEALLSILSDGAESDELRSIAVLSLGPLLEHADTDGFDDPDDVPISDDTFRKINESLHRLYLDGAVPKEVRRRVLEASVRAPRDWHKEAVRAAYSSGDEKWSLTAVFAMGWVRGFDEQIIEALGSDNMGIHYQAVCAAGNWEIDAAWTQVAKLVSTPGTDKALLLAAIDAAASIRSLEALEILADLIDSDDEDIAVAAHEAVVMAGGTWEDDFDDDD